MRKHSRSFIIYVFFGIIIAVFVVNFGPQSAGCVAGTSYAGKIAGQPITVADFSYAQAVWGLKAQSGGEEQLMQLRAMVMDRLIARELMASEAEARGIRIPPKEIEDMIFRGRYLALGEPRPLVRGDNGQFDYDRFSRYVRYYWGLTVRRFKAQQNRELLAEKLRMVLRTTTKVSEDEVKTDFIHRNTQVKLDYVRLAPLDYEKKITVDDAKLDEQIKRRKAEYKKYYDSNRHAYSKLPKQLKLQLLTVDFPPKDARAKAKAKKQADKLLARIKGGEDFGALAAAQSAHPSKDRRGELDWRTLDAPGLGKDASVVASNLKKGAISDVLEEEGRFLIVKLLERREGDLSYEQAEREIARKLYVEEQSTAAAVVDATKFIARAKAGEKLSEMFTSGEDETSSGDEPASAPSATPAADANKSPLKLASTGLFPRSPENLVPRIGISSDLLDAVFKLKAGAVADKPFIVNSMVYLVAVAERKDPDMKEWDKDRDELIEQFATRKWTEEVNAYAHDLCIEAAKNNEISVNPAAFVSPGYLEQQKRDGKVPTLPAYSPCKFLAPRPFAGL